MDDSLPTPIGPEMPVARMSHKRSIRIGIVILIAIVIGIGVTILVARKNPSTLNLGFTPQEHSSIAPTPVPYAELTIPYLRDKEYKSSLSERELVSSNANYDSYVTSYISDGLNINGLLTVPTGNAPEGGFPAIVFVHGYIPPSQYTTTSRYGDYVDYLARNGYVVFKIDLRGHGDSEGEAGGGYYGSDYVVDTLNARVALQNADFVNPEKIGLWGHSMAGNATMRAMAVKTEIPATAIWAGAVYSYEDQRKYGIQDNSYSPPANNVQRQNRRRDLFEKVGSPSAESPFWRQVAPIYYLNELQGAVGLFHAENDDVVNIGYSRDLADVLKKSSVPYELHEYASGGHNIDGGSFVTAMEETVAFYDKYLK